MHLRKSATAEMLNYFISQVNHKSNVVLIE